MKNSVLIWNTIWDKRLITLTDMSYEGCGVMVLLRMGCITNKG